MLLANFFYNFLNTNSKRKMSSIGGQTKRSKERIQRGSYYGVNNLDPSAENYITDAEINTRGYVDRNGQIHYSIPIFPKATESKHIAKKTGHVFISSENSERSIHSYTSNSKSELGDEKGTILGVITCSVGDSTDRGKLDYKVCDNGRIYELKCSNGPSMNAALVTNWYKNDNLSLS
ncbi:unnamed protein product [Brugia pahangi]|uniref:Ricin B-type lectin domain-containing protein n=1 Tax=Brugia pahangi TaxID=6280 RepID=A0A0N4T3Z2_BRUPA|nr:unnamed protein product [Brugia pahangi]